MRPAFSIDMRHSVWTVQANKMSLTYAKSYPEIDEIMDRTIELPPMNAFTNNDCVPNKDAGLGPVGEYLLQVDGFHKLLYGLWRAYQ